MTHFRLWRLLAMLAMLAACGARTAPGVDGGGAGACSDTPWILFDYVDGDTADLYAVHADGSTLHRVRLPSPRSLYHSLSPDGGSLLYVELPASSVGPALGTLVVYDLATRAPHVVRSGLLETEPALSPDGSLIAYVQGLDLHVMQRDVADDRTLLIGPFVSGCCGWGYRRPTFQTATTLFFATGGVIGTIHTDGTAQTTLLTSDVATLPYATPTLSPDGRQLASIIACPGTPASLRIYSVASLPTTCDSGTVVVADVLADERATLESPDPAWGPGDLIAFGHGNDVFVVPATGGVPRNVTFTLTATGGNAAHPAWAPGCTPLP